jgi:prepilin-type N-terminal cleavage/methylation domain-containing protein
VRPRTGVTLIELIVVIALLAVASTVSVVALRRARPPSVREAAIAHVMSARDSALLTGRRVSIALEDSVAGVLRSLPATAYPDGRVIADAVLGIDPLTGRPANAPH